MAEPRPDRPRKRRKPKMRPGDYVRKNIKRHPKAMKKLR